LRPVVRARAADSASLRRHDGRFAGAAVTIFDPDRKRFPANALTRRRIVQFGFLPRLDGRLVAGFAALIRSDGIGVDDQHGIDDANPDGNAEQRCQRDHFAVFETACCEPERKADIQRYRGGGVHRSDTEPLQFCVYTRKVLRVIRLTNAAGDRAVFHKTYTVRPGGMFRAVGDQQNTGVLFAHGITERLQDRSADRGIYIAGRLVRQQHRGSVDKRAGD
jgi:hypothetical protein